MRARANETRAERDEHGNVSGRLNQIRWQQRLPLWARILIFVLGVVVVGGAAIPKVSNITLPAVLLGSVLILFGRKGTPLIPSAWFATDSPGLRVTQGLKTMRTRLRTAIAFALICPLFVVGLMPLIPGPLLPTAFAVSVIPALVCTGYFFLTACPRCEHHFFGFRHFIGGGMTQCQRCNLSLNARHATSKQPPPRKPRG
jgi:hypothetical protein